MTTAIKFENFGNTLEMSGSTQIDPYGPMTKTWTASEVRKLDYSRCAYEDCHGRVRDFGGNMCPEHIEHAKKVLEERKTDEG